jgi:hypothetical protein
MPEFEKEEYKFPDEVKQEKEEIDIEIEGEPEIEIVEDRTREEKKSEKFAFRPKEVTEDELSEYSDKVKKRMGELQKGYHDERRRAEAALKEKDETLRLAKSIIEENKKLKGSLSQGQQALLEQAKKVVSNEVEAAKRQYKEAYELGNSDAVVEAQEALTAAKIKAERVNNFKPTLQEEENEVQIAPSEPQYQQVDRKAQAWQQENSWFGADDEMTSFALGYHSKLLKQGVDPQSDEYYEKLNTRIRQVFPESFDMEPSREPEKEPRKSTSNVVAPATRSTAPKKVVLTQRQVDIAKKLGVPLKLYAEKVAEEMRRV